MTDPELCPRLTHIFNMVRVELLHAIQKHGPMSSAHEGYAVILEELEEMWGEIKLKKRDEKVMMLEAVQVAAMAIRFVHDLSENQ